MKYLAAGVIIIIIMAVCSTQLSAQAETASPWYAISGMVRDPSGAAIAGARVTLTGAEGKRVSDTITDNSGAFRFDNVAAGDYQVDVQQQGFRESTTKVTVRGKTRNFVRVVMPIAVESQEVTVTA